MGEEKGLWFTPTSPEETVWVKFNPLFKVDIPKLKIHELQIAGIILLIQVNYQK